MRILEYGAWGPPSLSPFSSFQIPHLSENLSEGNDGLLGETLESYR